MQMSTYSPEQLVDTARWTLSTQVCTQGTRDHKLTLKSWMLRIHEANGTGASIEVVGECKRHHYQCTAYCAL